MSNAPGAKNAKSRLEEASTRWRTDRSLRWLIIGILLCVGLSLTLLLQLH